MKVDFFKGFKFINELYTVRVMTIAERNLIRQKKDLYNYIAIHLVSIIKSILIFGMLFTLIKFPDFISFHIFWLYVLTGLVFLIIDPIGIKALIDLVKKYFIQLIRSIKDIYKLSVDKYFRLIYESAKKYNIITKILYWFISILFFIIIPLPLAILKLAIMLSIYILVFLCITVLGNEALSLLVTNSLRYLIPLNNDFVLYIFYFISFVIIYFIIDYRIQQTKEALVVENLIDDGKEHIKGLELITTNGKIDIFKKDKKYLVFDKIKENVTYYVVNSKYNKRKQQLEMWVKKRTNK